MALDVSGAAGRPETDRQAGRQSAKVKLSLGPKQKEGIWDSSARRESHSSHMRDR